MYTKRFVSQSKLSVCLSKLRRRCLVTMSRQLPRVVLVSSSASSELSFVGNSDPSSWRSVPVPPRWLRMSTVRSATVRRNLEYSIGEQAAAISHFAFNQHTRSLSSPVLARSLADHLLLAQGDLRTGGTRAVGAEHRPVADLHASTGSARVVAQGCQGLHAILSSRWCA